MSEEEYHIKVSGSAIFKAVKNYVKTNGDLQRQIHDLVEQAIRDTGKFDMRKLVSDKLNSYTSWYLQDTMKKLIAETVREEVRAQLKQVLSEEVMNELVTNMVFSFKKEK